MNIVLLGLLSSVLILFMFLPFRMMTALFIQDYSLGRNHKKGSFGRGSNWIGGNCDKRCWLDIKNSSPSVFTPSARWNNGYPRVYVAYYQHNRSIGFEAADETYKQEFAYCSRGVKANAQCHRQSPLIRLPYLLRAVPRSANATLFRGSRSDSLIPLW